MLVHKHLIIRAEVAKPPQDAQMISEIWLPELIESIGMKTLMGPYSIYHDTPNNRGLTAVAIIETSHIALHVWDEDDPAMLQLDVYTCGPLDPVLVSTALENFEPVKVEMKYLDREHNLIEIPIAVEGGYTG